MSQGSIKRHVTLPQNRPCSQVSRDLLLAGGRAGSSRLVRLFDLSRWTPESGRHVWVTHRLLQDPSVTHAVPTRWNVSRINHPKDAVSHTHPHRPSPRHQLNPAAILLLCFLPISHLQALRVREGPSVDGAQLIDAPLRNQGHRCANVLVRALCSPEIFQLSLTVFSVAALSLHTVYISPKSHGSSKLQPPHPSRVSLSRAGGRQGDSAHLIPEIIFNGLSYHSELCCYTLNNITNIMTPNARLTHGADL